MKSVAEALPEIVAAFAPREAVLRSLADARGLALVDGVTADGDLPPFDDSAMDGYAVRHADLATAHGRMPVTGVSAAGGGMPPPLAPGSAMRIFTGAPLPDGADTVVIQENVEREGDAIVLRRTPNAGANVRRRGSDVASGSCALSRGTVLGPGEIAMLAALDIGAVRVHRPPRVAIVCTGDELREVGSARVPGTIVNSNAHALAAQVAEVGAVPWVLPPGRDDVREIAARLTEALAADCVVSAGGVSVGEHDHVREAFTLAGIEMRFWKVAIKPGKPLLFGTRGSVPVVALPGNPVSAMVTFEVFLKPALRRMLGFARPYPAPIAVELAHATRHATGRTEFARATLRVEDGRVRVHLHAQQGSGSIRSMTNVDALVVLAADRETFAAGESVPAIELRGAHWSDALPSLQ
jgi:molybdopterin molybdotransferase